MRLKQLDLLRGVAILLVLGRHPVVMPAEAGVFQPLAEFWLQIGWTGVDLFFVLSGFLIGGLLFNEIKLTSTIDVRRFLIRRGFKIWPAYYVLVIFMLLAVPIAVEPGKVLPIEDRFVLLLPHFVHAQNYFGIVGLHTWSLAVEEHFYLFLPIVLMVFVRVRRDRLFAYVTTLAVLISLACFALRWVTFADEFSDKLIPTHLRIDSLFFGVFLAAIYHLKPTWLAALVRYRAVLLAIGLLMITTVLFNRIEGLGSFLTWGFSLLYIGYGCLLIATISSSEQLTRSAFSKAAIFIGISSYSIYLWHWHLSAIIRILSKPWLSEFGSLKWAILMSVYILTATFFGYMMNRLIEAPALKLRDRFFPPQAPPVTNVTAIEDHQRSTGILSPVNG